MLKQHLIFILYSLCASVFKGEPTWTDVAVVQTGVVCGEVEAAWSVKDHLCFVTREGKLFHSAQTQERGELARL